MARLRSIRRLLVRFCWVAKSPARAVGLFDAIRDVARYLSDCKIARAV